MQKETGYAEVNGARLYYEMAGSGMPLVMIHAGIADCRMWDRDIAFFARRYRVVRFDMRGYGKSLPVAGRFNLQDDFEALLQALEIETPFMLMGCSMGGGLAIDYALEHGANVAAMALVGSGPAGLELQAEEPAALFAESQAAF